MTRYRVLVALSYPSDPAIIRRLQAGEHVPWPERRVREVQPGVVVDDIPDVSLFWLLEQGLIEPIEIEIEGEV